jgi:hypothetical protein
MLSGSNPNPVLGRYLDVRLNIVERRAPGLCGSRRGDNQPIANCESRYGYRAKHELSA